MYVIFFKIRIIMKIASYSKLQFLGKILKSDKSNTFIPGLPGFRNQVKWVLKPKKFGNHCLIVKRL